MLCFECSLPAQAIDVVLGGQTRTCYLRSAPAAHMHTPAKPHMPACSSGVLCSQGISDHSEMQVCIFVKCTYAPGHAMQMHYEIMSARSQTNVCGMRQCARAIAQCIRAQGGRLGDGHAHTLLHVQCHGPTAVRQQEGVSEAAAGWWEPPVHAVHASPALKGPGVAAGQSAPPAYLEKHNARVWI